MGALQREQFERQVGELPGADRGGGPGNQRTQPGGEIGKFFIHAVFDCRLVFRYSRLA
jgi:hypothetical protein